MYKFEPFYRVKVERVIDGDTLVISFYLGLGIWLNDQKVRLLGINAPEVKGESRSIGLEVTNYLKSLLAKSDGVIIRTDEEKKGKYGRFLVVLYGKIDNKWQNLNQKLVTVGAAQEYMASDAADAKEIFDPKPEDIESRVDLDEDKTDKEVYGEDPKEVAASLLLFAREILSGARGSD